MKFEEIIGVIKMFAKSQGFYGRLLYAIENADEEQKEMIKRELEQQDFKDPLDVVFYFEC